MSGSTIVGSDASSLILAGPNGTTTTVPGEMVADIDHPGNVHLTIGLVMLGIGALYVAGTYGKVIEPMQDQSQNGAVRDAALVYLLPGAVLSAIGGYIYGRSRHNAHAFESASRAP